MNKQHFFEKINKFDFKLDEKILNIMKTGIKLFFSVCVLAIIILITYLIGNKVNVYYIGISLFKTGLFLIVGVIICGIAFNNIMKEL